MLSAHRSAAHARERRYRRIAADPVIAARTQFFLAAAVVTKALATRELPAFFTRLGAMLEVANVRRAREIRAGTLYRAGSVQGNTADFVHFEQSLVEAELDRLRAHDPRAYQDVVACANVQILRATARVARWLNREFARAVMVTRQQLGREIDFGRRGDREILGNAIARESGSG
jgi:hypothetical protein